METNLEKAKRFIKVNALVSGIELPDDGFIMQMLELAGTPNKLNQAEVSNRRELLFAFLKANENQTIPDYDSNKHLMIDAFLGKQ